MADEGRDAKEIGTSKAEVRDPELRLAKRLVERLRVDEFDPTKYHGAFRERLEQAAREKAKGQPLEIGEPASARTPVIDLMEALQESLRKPPVQARAREGASVIASPAARPAKRRQRGAA